MTSSSVEKTPVHVFGDSYDVSKTVAKEIADLMRKKAAEGQSCVLGLATGSTPMTVYNELVRMHQEEGLSFQNVVTFNLDEYYPMQPEELQSYSRFMAEHLFDHVDIDPKNTHIPDGTVGEESIGQYCITYEERILAAGGLDLQLLGIGRTGHVGFNEPGSSADSQTRLITLDKVTRKDAASDFFGEENVPRRAITMGVGTILCADRVILMAFGEGKTAVIAKAVEGPITTAIAASFLQEHPNAGFYLDQAAAEGLTRFKSPWLATTIEWNDETIRKAVIWLARKTQKPILKLTDEDYNEHHLQDLLAESGPAYNLNLEVFRHLSRTITGWPGGKPTGPGPFPKRILVFSPHPDDDVISMGGTLIRLADHDHEVHVAYQVSGNIAVFDEDALRFVDFATEFNKLFEFDNEQTAELERGMAKFLLEKRPGQVDTNDIQAVKGLIRRGEAKAAAVYCGVPREHLHFLDMPFYETGRVTKKPLSEADVDLIVDLLRKVEPHQIYVAGDLSDPHGTHRTCLSAILHALDRVENDSWYAGAEIWLYRGAWQEWAPEEIHMAVPLSPAELTKKITAIFKHESQKDKALFPGADEREFWQRAEQRNRETARLYDQLGLAEYEAIEAFVRWSARQTHGLTSTPLVEA